MVEWILYLYAKKEKITDLFKQLAYSKIVTPSIEVSNIDFPEKKKLMEIANQHRITLKERHPLSNSLQAYVMIGTTISSWYESDLRVFAYHIFLYNRESPRFYLKDVKLLSDALEPIKFELRQETEIQTHFQGRWDYESFCNKLIPEMIKKEGFE
jgi:hypothetical protein